MRFWKESLLASCMMIPSVAAAADSISGGYVGISGALGDSFISEYEEPNALSVSASGMDTFSSADIALGYNLVTDDDILLGAEAFYTTGGPEDDLLSTDDLSIQVSKDNGFGLKGKIGYAINDSSAFYGVLGYTQVEGKLTAKTNNNEFDFTDDFGGTVFGVGGVFSVADNLLVTTEGTYSDLSDESYNGYSFDSKETRVTVGVAYRFDM